MKLSPVKLGNTLVKLPILQGGMAVKVSLAPLAAAVADCNGVGIIAGTGMKAGELVEEIRKARGLTRGLLGVNVLFAVNNFAELIKAAVHEKIDFIISGAGFSRDMFSWGRSAGIPVIPIVSSGRLAKISEKMGASGVIVEGKEAGGHLGTDRPLKEVLPEVRKAVKIPVIAAGGIVSGEEIAEALRLGADGVQMATRFVLSRECTVSDNFKEYYLKSGKEDVIIIRSPVGLLGRALRSPFTERLARQEKIPIKNCGRCLKNCSGDYCILEALKRATEGDMEEGLIFSGENVYKVKDILPVQQIIKDLLGQLDRISRG